MNYTEMHPLNELERGGIVLDWLDLSSVDLDNPDTYLIHGTNQYRVLANYPDDLPDIPYMNIRAHHLPNFWRHYGNYCFYRAAKEDRDYEGPDFDFNEDKFWEDSVMKIFIYSNREGYIRDLAGDEEGGEERHAEQSTPMYKKLATLPTETMVAFSILPDTVCYACQLTPDNEVGNHCRVVTAKDLLEIQKLTNGFDSHPKEDLYRPFLKSADGTIVGIVTTKANLFNSAEQHIYEEPYRG